MKLKIIIDSSAGLTKKEANKKGWGFLPMLLDINGKEYADGIDINPKEYYNKIKLENNVKTSATPPGIILEKISEASQNNDYVIIYPLSKELSSQTNNIQLISKKFDNVFVVPSKGIGYAITRDCEELEKMSKNNISWDKIKSTSIKMTNNQYGIAAVKTLSWLVKGGRISHNIAKMANLLKIIPLISFQNGKLNKYGKGRVFEKSITKMAAKLFKEIGQNAEYIIYSSENNTSNIIIENIKEKLNIKNIIIKPFPPIIGNHIGPGCIAIISRQNII